MRAFDAGLRPDPFPGQAASLLPGLLAATRTGLTPASDDELTNTKIHRGSRHGLTSHSAGRTKDIEANRSHDGEDASRDLLGGLINECKHMV
jgi:hypothetical protein